MILADDSGAWTKYPLNVQFKYENLIQLDHIDDIVMNIREPVILPMKLNSLNIKAISWDGDTLDWIWYSPDVQSLYILDQNKWQFHNGKIIF